MIFSLPKDVGAFIMLAGAGASGTPAGDGRASGPMR